MQLSRAAAELLKMRVGVAPTPDARVQEEVLVAGRGMRNGLPESQRVPIAELHAAMEKPCAAWWTRWPTRWRRRRPNCARTCGTAASC
ncbi:hypothetical protein ACFQZC_07865 [Streptacidiphilus monticola]